MQVFDNGGATFDRYTVVTKEGDIITMSDRPQSPSGVNAYSHTLEVGEEYERKNNERMVALKDVPAEILVAIIARLEEK